MVESIYYIVLHYTLELRHSRCSRARATPQAASQAPSAACDSTRRSLFILLSAGMGLYITRCERTRESALFTGGFLACSQHGKSAITPTRNDPSLCYQAASPARSAACDSTRRRPWAMRKWRRRTACCSRPSILLYLYIVA